MKRRYNLIVISICLLCIISAYHYQIPTNSSGFVFSRIADLTYNTPTGDIQEGYNTFPAVAGLLGTLTVVTDLNLLTIIHLPLTIGFGILSLFLVTRIATGGVAAVLVSISIILFSFANNGAFQEYDFMMAVYPFFIFIIHKYVISHDLRWGLLSIIFFIATMIISIRTGQWAVGFLIALCALLVASKRISAAHISTRAPYALGALAILVFFWYNPKFYEQLIFRLIELDALFQSSEPADESVYAASSSTPSYFSFLNTAWYVLATLPVALGFLYSTVKESWNPLDRSFTELFFLAILLGASTDIIIRLVIGRGLSLRIVALLSPIVAVYYLHTKLSKDAYLIFGVTFLILSGAIAGLGIIETQEREALSPDSAEGVAIYIYHYGDETEAIIDHHTRGEIRLALAKMDIQPRIFHQYPYDDDVMKMVFEFDEPPHEAPKFMVVNNKNYEMDIWIGQDWHTYQPLSDAPDFQNNHRDLNKVYFNGDATVLGKSDNTRDDTSN
jgi:hypothetical protein